MCWVKSVKDLANYCCARKSPYLLNSGKLLAISMLYAETEVLNSGLGSAERLELVKRFNDPDDDDIILIIMHAVSIQDVNLDKCGNRVLVVTNASNAP